MAASDDEEIESEISSPEKNIESFLGGDVNNLDESLTSMYTNKTVKDITIKDYEAEIAKQNAFLASL